MRLRRKIFLLSSCFHGAKDTSISFLGGARRFHGPHQGFDQRRKLFQILEKRGIGDKADKTGWTVKEFSTVSRKTACGSNAMNGP